MKNQLECMVPALKRFDSFPTGLVRQYRMPAVMASILIPAFDKLAAQTITSAAATTIAVPVDRVGMLVAAAVALATLASWIFRGRQRLGSWPIILVVSTMAIALSNGSTLWAQVVAQFTNPSGETLPIPIVAITANGDLQGFEPADFLNATGQPLRIAALTPPDLNTCFPLSPTTPLPPPLNGGPPSCDTGILLAAGTSCRVNVDAICKSLFMQTAASISLSPSNLTIPSNSTATVTVQTSAASPVAALNLAATIPAGSGLSVQNSTCGTSLAPAASCTITFASTSVEGPTAISVAGTNAPSTSLFVSVAANPTISITGPSQATRIIAVGSATPLALTVTNDATSALNANSITVSDMTASPDLAVDNSDCASLAPGASCTLLLTSITPYAPSSITISGSNTANSPTTLVAFSHLGGLVFEASGGAGKTVSDVTQQFSSQWTSTQTDISGAGSTTDGRSNTDAIVADPSCHGAPGSCAAQRCRDIGPDWYLPATTEISSAVSALCPAGAACTFGAFSGTTYLTSTQSSYLGMRVLIRPMNVIGVSGKLGTFAGRCIRAFSP